MSTDEGQVLDGFHQFLPCYLAGPCDELTNRHRLFTDQLPPSCQQGLKRFVVWVMSNLISQARRRIRQAQPHQRVPAQRGPFAPIARDVESRRLWGTGLSIGL